VWRVAWRVEENPVMLTYQGLKGSFNDEVWRVWSSFPVNLYVFIYSVYTGKPSTTLHK
jgi:hypothetical protein